MRLTAVLVRRTDDSVPDWVTELTCVPPPHMPGLRGMRRYGPAMRKT
jgi:hypothetical protein